jgi:hypothetical protein
VSVTAAAAAAAATDWHWQTPSPTGAGPGEWECDRRLRWEAPTPGDSEDSEPGAAQVTEDSEPGAAQVKLRGTLDGPSAGLGSSLSYKWDQNS